MFQVKSLISKLTEEKNSAVQLRNKLQQEMVRVLHHSILLSNSSFEWNALNIITYKMIQI